MTTPPGWYPDPGHTGPGPALERWWDGSTWTDYTREAQALALSDAPPGQPGLGSYQPPSPPLPDFGLMEPSGPPLSGFGSPPTGGRSRGRTIAIAGGATVLVAAIVGGVMLLGGGDDDGSDQAGPNPSTSSQQQSPPDGGSAGGRGGGDATPDPGPSGATDSAPDVVNGITVPVLDGWRAGRSGSGGAAVTIGPYPCPGDKATNCVRGGVFSRTAVGYDAKTAEGVAKEDIAKNAEDSYGRDPQSGKQMYGGITSHRQLKSAAVTVAGQKGYLVRWKVATRKGDDGYVQSLVFPAPDDPRSLVLVRFGFDVSDKAPPLTDMDKITRGIAPLEGGGGTGGAA
ncbi:DUF2510 domain-containing protein [Streptomyces sp. KR80]|uniref:DUF2510 domain-containing protein n=1 Tax=Streptomyces sp. KR80 TaxID=3457426 RepID=UPI003FD21CD4